MTRLVRQYSGASPDNYMEFDLFEDGSDTLFVFRYNGTTITYSVKRLPSHLFDMLDSAINNRETFKYFGSDITIKYHYNKGLCLEVHIGGFTYRLNAVS